MFKDIRATIEIDLTEPIETLWNKVNKKARWGVKKAEKEGLVFEYTEKEEDWKRFYSIYTKTIIIGGIVPEKFEEIKEKGNLLFICKRGEQIIAGAIIKVREDSYELRYNASLYEFQKFQPNNLLYWGLIKWGKEKNFKIFDLGGYQLEASGHLSGVNKFKERWGGEIKKYDVYSKNPFYILGRKVIRNVPLVKAVREKIKLWTYSIKADGPKKIKKVGIFIKKEGFIKFMKKIFEKLIYGRKIFVLFLSDLKDEEKIKPKIKVVFKKVDPTEIKKLPEVGYLSFDEFEDRFNQGKECFVFLDGGKVVHYSWVTYEEMDISELRMEIPLDKNAACIFDCYTSKKFRGLSLYPSMLCEIKDYLKKRNFENCYIYSDLENAASIRGIEKAGFKKFNFLKYLNLLGFKKKSVEDLF
jgi:hypothetical protein